MSAASPPPSPHIALMGCRIDNLDMRETVDRVEGFIASGRPHQHVVVNVDKLVKAARDPQLREIINACALVNADGMPVVWASRLLGRPLKERVTGVDLFEALMQRAAQRGWKVYLLGAREPVVAQVRALYSQRNPAVDVVGHRNGYWPAGEDEAVAEAIRRSGAQLLFVAISSPRKEEFLSRWQQHMQVPFAMGVGGTFDVVTGAVQRAPVWMQRSGLEWFYRFLQEPRRMFRRYFIEDMAFIGLLWTEWRTSRRDARGGGR
ncbi:WecB/TagA/CpsF family glycosyltransferase [Ideonella sp. A 288]|uniref:WecB/TagA/CpsF family glycosyltransferase n=1 Tax=Ideonella sp. A 288 TaxID=1962181 RepID=UPI001F368B0D|nr:WecB/TagA/CpsF family glycosyltransferase [Ideonella sp. A 288]